MRHCTLETTHNNLLLRRQNREQKKALFPPEILYKRKNYSTVHSLKNKKDLKIDIQNNTVRNSNSGHEMFIFVIAIVINISLILVLPNVHARQQERKEDGVPDICLAVAYGDLWGCTYQKHTKKLQLLQNKAIRVICNSNRFSSVTPLYFELGILKINELFKFEIAKLMHQHSHNLLPPGISSLFTVLSTIHSRQTRSQTQKSLYLPKFSTQRCQRSIKFQGTKIWNSFSPEFKILSFRKFKSKFKNLLIATHHVVN